MLVKLVHQRLCSVHWEMLEASLKDTTTVRMGRQIVNMSTENADKGQALGGYSLDKFLDHLKVMINHM
jgi:hypothetical protein